MKNLLLTVAGALLISLAPFFALSQCPTPYTVEGQTTFCANTGATVELSNSEVGAMYQLQKRKILFPFGYENTGSPRPGTGARLFFTGQNAGTYRIIATMNGCSSQMSGTLSATGLSTPPFFTLTSNSECDGSLTFTLSASNPTSTFTLRNLTTNTAYGTVPGTGQAIAWNGISGTGIYTVIGQHTETFCTQQMNSITIYENPLSHHLVSTNATLCGGSATQVLLSGSQTGINYQLQQIVSGSDVNVGSPVAGTGSSIAFNIDPNTVATYKVLAIRETSPFCSIAMTGTAKVNIPVSQYTLSTSNHCVGAGGSSVLTLSDSEAGVIYRLKRSGVDYGTSISGTGDAISWPPISVDGTYVAYATISGSACSTQMFSAVVLSARPQVFAISGSSILCQGEFGTIPMTGSQTGVNYELIKVTGIPPIEINTVISTRPGTGAPMSFSFTAEQDARYKVKGVRGNPPYGNCEAYMTGEYQSFVNPLSAAYTVSQVGTCANSNAFILLNGSTGTASYQLRSAGIDIGVPKPGTGGTLQWDNINAAGSYSVFALNGSCSRQMNGGAQINPMPGTYTVGGSDIFCAGGTNSITLSGSEAGVSYALMESNLDRVTLPGTGGPLSFPFHTAGTYTVRAITQLQCSATMEGEKIIPAALENYPLEFYGPCSNYVVYLAQSQEGVIYNLYKNGAYHSYREGTGGSVSWNPTGQGGTYHVVATKAVNGQTCAVSTLFPITPVPNNHGITGGTFCTGGTATITLQDTDFNVIYEPGIMPPFFDFIAMPSDVQVWGTGGQIEMTFSDATSMYYKVRATSSISGCSRVLSSTAQIVMEDCGTGGGRVKPPEEISQTLAYDETELTVFPNPAEDHIQVTLPDGWGSHGKISVLSNTGSEVSVTYKLYGRAIDVQVKSLPAGIYLLNIETGKRKYLRRFVKR